VHIVVFQAVVVVEKHNDFSKACVRAENPSSIT
jgi:hypothetical protein